MGWLMQRAGTSGRTAYTAMYRDIRGRKRSAGTFSSRREAERAWQRAQTHQEMGRVRELKQGRQGLRHYIETTWLPNHVMELSTRERYTYLITKWILPELGDLPIADLMPSDVREWVRRLGEVHDLNPPTIKYAKNVLDAVLTTALNDQLTFLHAGRGVKTPPVATRPPPVLSVEQFEALYRAVEDPTMRLMIETAIESGLRWGELTELRAGDLNTATGVLTVTRSVLHLKATTWQGPRFVVKDYPKDKQWRRLGLADHLVTKLATHISEHHLGPGDLLFQMPDQDQPRRHTRPAELPNPATLGLTEPNQHGRRYRHGTPTAYGAGRCRCQPCRDSVAAYRAARRADGHDSPRPPRTLQTDGHIPNDWFRAHILLPAARAAGLTHPVTPHGLRHAHASWLLAGGADLQVVKERLGHTSITTTQRYLHTLPGADHAALTALDNIRRPHS
jgi:integrase